MFDSEKDLTGNTDRGLKTVHHRRDEKLCQRRPWACEQAYSSALPVFSWVFTLFSFLFQRSYRSTGALFTHWIADSLTLWKSPVTDEHLWTAAVYYSILAKGPSEILYFFAAVALLGCATIVWSLNDLRAGNIMFDGGSICKFELHSPCLLPLTDNTSPLRYNNHIVHPHRASEYVSPSSPFSLSKLVNLPLRHFHKIRHPPLSQPPRPNPLLTPNRNIRSRIKQPHLQRRSHRRLSPPSRQIMGGAPR